MTNTELAKRSYEASRTAAGQNLDGKSIPSWDDTTPAIRDLWEQAAGATYRDTQAPVQQRAIQGQNLSPETHDPNAPAPSDSNAPSDAPSINPNTGNVQNPDHAVRGITTSKDLSADKPASRK